MKQLKASCKALLLILLLISTFGLTNACKQSENGKEETNKIKTEWTDCQELIEFIRYSTYDGVASSFGDNTIGEPWDASGVGEMDMMVEVRFNKIKLNGKPLVVIYKNSFYELGDAFKKNPLQFSAVKCNGEWSEKNNSTAQTNDIENYYDYDVESWKSYKASFWESITYQDIDRIEVSSLEGSDFHDGGVGGTVTEFFNDPEAWENVKKSLESGFKDYKIEDKQYSSAKITNDDKLIFVRKGDFWKWYGFKTN